MTFVLNIAPSLVAKLAKEDEAAGESVDDKKKSRDEYRKAKELEEARKAGTVPALQDEAGKDINPHIPQYVMQAPWYYGKTAPTLQHQRLQQDPEAGKAKYVQWYKRGVEPKKRPTKFRKGACENCGSMTHKKKDCFERPRKIGAKWTGTDLAPDEHDQPDLDFSWQGKRDRWNGFDTDDYNELMTSKYEKLDEAKRQLKAERLEEKLKSGDLGKGVSSNDTLDDDDDEDDEEKHYAENIDMPGQRFEAKERQTVRNLRIREDTAKYLLNLDPDSAYYDPKTRSMRGNPHKDGSKDASYVGDNFVRCSGDAYEMAKQQLFAWEAYDKGADVHLNADPTKLEFLTKQFKSKKSELVSSAKEKLLDKYGGTEHLEAPPKALLLAQTEEYVEYARDGSVVKGEEKAIPNSKYEEDVYNNNHTSVWGSFWKDGLWGYACCHQFIKESYCTGQAGIDAESTSAPLQITSGTEAEKKSLVQLHQEKRKADRIAAKKAKREAAKAAIATDAKTSPSVEKEAKKRKLGLDKAKKRKRRGGGEEEEEKDKDAKSSSSSDSSSDDSSDSSSESSSDSSSSSNADEGEDKAEVSAKKKLKLAQREQDKRQREAEQHLATDERKRPYMSMEEVKPVTEEELEAWRLKQHRQDDPMANFMNR